MYKNFSYKWNCMIHAVLKLALFIFHILDIFLN